jgi:predicted kinase
VDRPEAAQTSSPRLLLINGLPASGKTTLSRALAPELGLPLFGKDDLKDLLFDQLGWSDRERSKQIGGAAWELLWLIADRTLRAGGSLAIESNFVTERAAERLAQWHVALAIHVVELHCTADRDVLVQRFRDRALGSDRHPGHDETNLVALETEFVPRLLTDEDALIPGTDGAMVVDTTHPATINLPTIAADLRRLLWP